LNNLLNGDICKIKNEYLSKINEENLEANIKSNRLYMYLTVKYKDLIFLVPFESDLFQKNQPAIYPLPTEKKPNAGLNFEKTLILDDESQIEKIEFEDLKIPRSQKNKIVDDLEEINEKFNRYIENFIKTCAKNRENREFAYRFSTLKEESYKKKILN